MGFLDRKEKRMDKRELTRIEGNLRSKYLEMPEEIYRAKGLVIMG